MNLEAFVETHKKILDKYKKQICDIIGEEDWVLNRYDDRLEKEHHLKFSLLHGRDHRSTVARWTLAQLPGCCGVCVSTGAYVYPQFRKKGLGTLLNLLRIEQAKALGYGLLMCTDVMDNAPQRKLLNKNGWKEIVTFNNPRTKNDIAMHVIDLNER